MVILDITNTSNWSLGNGHLSEKVQIPRTKKTNLLSPPRKCTNGVTANLSLFDRGTFWGTLVTYVIFPGLTFFPNLTKLMIFALAPLVLTPFCPQPKRPLHRCERLVPNCIRSLASSAVREAGNPLT